jgi:hypothetical protein
MAIATGTRIGCDETLASLADLRRALWPAEAS